VEYQALPGGPSDRRRPDETSSRVKATLRSSCPIRAGAATTTTSPVPAGNRHTGPPQPAQVSPAGGFGGEAGRPSPGQPGHLRNLGVVGVRHPEDRHAADPDQVLELVRWCQVNSRL
jgi:hypothetical protein